MVKIRANSESDSKDSQIIKPKVKRIQANVNMKYNIKKSEIS